MTGTIYELSPTRIQHNEQLMLPGMSLGRLHAKAAVIEQSMVYLGSLNLDRRSESTNTELGLAMCPELAKEVIRVINVSKLQSSYRLQIAPDGQSLEWLATESGRRGTFRGAGGYTFDAASEYVARAFRT
jgi:putative cardiolipin synthase